MTLREHPVLSRALDAAGRYRAGALTATELQRTLSGVMSAVESDVPKTVRDALFEAEARVDSACFTTNTADQPEAIAKILDDFEAVLDSTDRHG